MPLEEGRSILDSLLAGGVDLAHECGGKLACTSCRVIATEGLETMSPAGEEELVMLDRVGAMEPGARLACQAIAADENIGIAIPQAEAPVVAESLRSATLPVSLSGTAARHLAALLGRLPGAKAIRLGTSPSGCSGFGYRVAAADATQVDDVVFESGGVRIAIDQASLPYLEGTTLDLVQEGLAWRLRFENPNARSTCVCGESFGM